MKAIDQMKLARKGINSCMRRSRWGGRKNNWWMFEELGFNKINLINEVEVEKLEEKGKVEDKYRS